MIEDHRLPGLPLSSNTYTMIIENFKHFNSFTDINSNTTTFSLNNERFYSLKCLYCGCSCFHRHGFYSRSLIDLCCNTSTVVIERVKCTSCKHTHALIPSSIIPYLSLSFNVIKSIISSYLDNLSVTVISFKHSVDCNTVRRIINIFNLHHSILFNFLNLLFTDSTKFIVSAFSFLNPSYYIVDLKESNKIDGRSRLVKYFMHAFLSS